MATKHEELDGVTYQYSADWIKKLEGLHHWKHYWYQQNVISKCNKDGYSILEIGVGSGFTKNYLKSKGFSVTTIDIDKDKEPDIVANIVNYNFKEQYDLIIAFEVFEHIPYDKAINVINKLSRVCRKSLILSVPKNEKTLFRAEGLMPIIGDYNLQITIPKRKITTLNHFWEIGYKEYTLTKFVEDVNKTGFNHSKHSKNNSLLYFTFNKA